MKILLAGLFFWNIYGTINTQNLLGLLSIIVTGSLFYFVYSKHRFAKDALLYWSGFLIAIFVVIIIAHLVRHLAGGTTDEINYLKLGFRLFDIVVFLLVYRGAEDYIIKEPVDPEEIKEEESEINIEDHLISDEE